MGFLDRVGRNLTEKRHSSADDRWWTPLSEFTAQTFAGKSVTPESALTGTVAVYAAVGLLAETVGSLPLHVYSRDDDRNRTRVQSGSGWPGGMARMLHEVPNPEMSAQELWETVEGHLNLWGNFYGYVRRDGMGRPRELWPLRPDMMTVVREQNDRGLPVGPRRYVYRLPNGEPRGFGRSEIMHVMDFATDGLKGLSRIEVARQAVGVEQAAAEYAGRFFSNSAIPSGALVTDQHLDESVIKQLSSQWKSAYGGLSKAQSTAILHSGITWEQVGIPPRDAQFIELRQFQIGEIARLYRIPPHMIGEVERSTSWGTGIEHQSIGFVVYTLRPHLKRIESALNRDLGDPDVGRTLLDDQLFAEFKVEGLLRGDMESRSSFYSKGINDGWLTPEDVRAIENMSYIDGLDRPRVPLNMALVNADGSLQVPERPGQPQSLRAAYEEHLRELRQGEPT
jgi:HK97 family phage portal protein